MYTVHTIIDTEELVPNLAALLEEGLDEAAAQVLELFEETARTWQQQPTFDIQKESFVRIVGTDDLLYNWTSNGTERHLIPLQPKVVGELVFPTDTTPKTTPGVLTSSSGFRGAPNRRAKQVSHPGTTPREFDKQIATLWEQEGTLARILQAKIDGAVK